MSDDDPFGWPDDRPTPLEATDSITWHARSLGKRDDLTDADDVQALGELLAALDQAVAELTATRDAVAAATAEAMPTDDYPVAGIGVLSRSVSRSTTWDTQAVRDAVYDAIQARYPGQEELVLSIWSLMLDALGGTPKVKGLTRLDIEPDEYRAVTPTGWRVKLMRVESVATPEQENRW